MNCRSAAIGWSLLGLLALTPSLASADESGAKPLRLALATVPAAPVQARNQAQLRPDLGRTGAGHRAARLDQRDPSLGQRALLSVLDEAETVDAELAQAGSGGGRFQFERRGSAGRDISRGYKDMCAKVSNKLWDDPAGRRVKFDIAGKPGVALVIPLH
jgi:hypothetical protein